MASTHRDEISRLELLHAAHPDGLVFPHLADAYRRAGRYAQAESLLTEGLQRHSDFSSAHVVLGRLRLDQGRADEAATAFRRVLQLDPRNPVALEYLGRIAADDGRPAEALQHFRRLYRLKPTGEIAEQIRMLERRLRSASGERERSPPGMDPAGGPDPAGTNGGVGAGPGTGSGREGDSGRPLPEPGEVVTETMAELYARQGLHDRAVAVYRQLVDRDPGDTRLLAKLEAARARRDDAAGSAGGARKREAPAATQPEPWPDRRGGSPPNFEWKPPWPKPARPLPEAAPDREGRPEARPASSPTIGQQLRTLLAWQPAAPVEPEPWASTPGSGEQPVAAIDARASEAQSGTADSVGWSHRERVLGSAPIALLGDTGAPDALEGADAQARTLIALTDLLVGLLEYRDPFFRGGSSLTRLLAANVAEEMGLSRTERVHLALAAVLRDLGRLAMGGKLVTAQKFGPTPEARRKIERHVDLALHLMEGIEVPDPVRAAVRHHHERWDGAGYPEGLAGEQIPLLARILAVVDSFGAMVSPRPYRLPRKVPEAERELREASGSQLDPRPVNALLRVLARRDQPHLGFVQRHHILLVNPDQPGALVNATKLCSAGYLAEVAMKPEAARERLRRVPVAALVLSAEIGEEEAATLVRELRMDPSFASLPVVITDGESVAFRVRMLESGADVCFPPGISYGELQGTLGALVRRTIRSRRMATTGPTAGSDEAPWLALQGDVEDFPMTWLLQVMKYDSRTAGIGVRTATRHGAIYLENGDAIHAQIRGGARGEAALREMLQWKKGRFTVQPDARPRERTIDTSIMHLLLTQAVEEDHAAAGIFGAVAPDA